MEPMTLGSPVGSPSPTSPYLPGFLIGDPVPQQTSPTKTPRQVHFASNLSTSVQTPNTPTTSGPVTLNDSLTRYQKSQREKAGGPPTMGLFDTLEVTATALSSSISPTVPFNQAGQLSQPTSFTPVHQTQLGQASQVTSAGTAVSDESERWVTVFGFPAAAASSILGQFSQVGHIVEHRFPGQGNWVNICYASKIDARRALSYNGKILGGHTMIGVVPCRDYILSWKINPRKYHFYDIKVYTGESMVREYQYKYCMQSGSALKDMTNVLNSTATPTTPKSPQMSRMSQRRLLTSPVSPYPPSPRLGRPLGISSPAESEVIGAQNTPTKNTSFVTRAVDLFFGK